MAVSRRTLLKLAGISVLGLPFFRKALAMENGVRKVLLPQRLPDPEALTAKRWGVVVDTRRIKTADDLSPILEACRKAHNIPTFENKNHEVQWIWTEPFENAFPALTPYPSAKEKALPFLVLCNHCSNPPCVRACPTRATYQRPDGIVMMDFHRCIGCRVCMAACPYGARSFNFRDPVPFIQEKTPQFPTRTKGVVEKCNFCEERLAVGKLPACVEESSGILTFGDLGDPASEVRRLLSGAPSHFDERNILEPNRMFTTSCEAVSCLNFR